MFSRLFFQSLSPRICFLEGKFIRINIRKKFFLRAKGIPVAGYVKRHVKYVHRFEAFKGRRSRLCLSVHDEKEDEISIFSERQVFIKVLSGGEARKRDEDLRNVEG